MEILVTGGTGYIGSHTCVELLNAGHKVIIVDNLLNSKEEVLSRIEKITGKNIKFYKIDISDEEKLEHVFDGNNIDAVIHFAGLKSVGESVKMPMKYYYNNVTGTLILCGLMKKYNVKRMVFSSSATVYGNSDIVPVKENFPLSATNPYGRTKLMIEEILRDIYNSDQEWCVSLLRYFNPIGAHESGTIGEDPNDIPNNLMPYITKVALGKIDELIVFGDNYDTHDGTGVRDYIHVVDLAKGHLKALEGLIKNKGINEYNLGTGTGYSVLDVINNFEIATGKKVPYIIKERRAGDIDKSYADPTKAYIELGWKAEKNIMSMCKDAWNWQINNPDGYK